MISARPETVGKRVRRGDLRNIVSSSDRLLGQSAPTVCLHSLIENLTCNNAFLCPSSVEANNSGSLACFGASVSAQLIDPDIERQLNGQVIRTFFQQRFAVKMQVPLT